MITISASENSCGGRRIGLWARPMSPLKTSRHCLPVLCSSDIELHGGSAQDMAGVAKGNVHAVGYRDLAMEADADELVETGRCDVSLGVERLDGRLAVAGRASCSHIRRPAPGCDRCP